MNRKEKRELKDCRSLLYPAPCPKPDPDRLLVLMQGWWRGRSQADMAAEYGLSQQRVSAILRWVGCTQGLLHKAKRERPDSPRRALRNRIFEAQASLKHTGFERLTIKQRCAVAWQATGLTLVDIATRMAVTPQAVQQFLVGARWRLERLESHRVHDDLNIAPLNWGDLFKPLDSPTPIPEESAQGAPVRACGPTARKE